MDVVVIGAGMSGLVAARELVAAGARVRVIDKGRSVGGRLATRRIGDARLDHGAQFFTVRTPAFQQRVDDWLDRGLVRVWTHGFGDGDGHPRYVATEGMNSLAKDLATGLDVEVATMAFTIRPARRSGDPHRWDVVIDDGTQRAADAVILTTPLAQAFSLLIDAGADDVELEEQLFRTPYDRTIGLLAVLDGPSSVPAPGGMQHGDDVFSFIGDNHAKGVSEVHAVTFHANPTWSAEHWDESSERLLERLEQAAAPWLGSASIVERELKKWRFATPQRIWPDPCWTTGGGSIVLAGDAFAGPKVEGAHNSGLAAAHTLLA